MKAMQKQSRCPLKNQLRWQSLRPFNITIMCSIIFFLIIGIIQSYTVFNAIPTFTTLLYVPLSILLLSFSILVGLIKNYHKFTQVISPITCFLITFFISTNSYFQQQTAYNSLFYLLLLLPLFYSYLLAYDTKYLLINNILIVLCYIIAAIFSEADRLAFLFNSVFLLVLCYLTSSIQLRHSKASPPSVQVNSVGNTIIPPKTGRYLNRIIHDIRQPLSSLSLYSHLLENKLHDSPHQQLAKNIKLASEDLDRWLSSLLDLARLDSGAIVANENIFLLSSALSPSIKKYQFQATDIGIEVKSRISALNINSDQKLLTEIVEALLSNALIHGKQNAGAKVLLSVRRYHGKALLQVWNQGVKIPAEILTPLFDEIALADNPLHNKSKGIGLGLPIAQRKAKLCKTQLTVTTNDNGSCFSLLLDTVKNSSTPVNLNTLLASSVDAKILLIDDDQGILNALSLLLENWGYKVDCADTAEVGLLQFKTKDYDLVITDYRFSSQQTGLDVIKAIKDINDIPAVLLTGEADPRRLKEVQKMAKEVNYKILNKPVKPAALRFLLTQLLK